MSLVMGMDQHRAQISAEWIDTITGEISRARVAPADRAGVRAFLAQFHGEPLEVALEATTGWRFVVEKLEQVSAEVRLAEPAEAASLKGKKKRAKTDWADARHLRELLLIGRLPESWIPPAHILDLRARVRTRHLLSHQRTEWQQRIHAVLYHHGVPQQRNLLTIQKREWLAELTLPAAAREQLTVALSVIDALDAKLVPFDVELRAYAYKQPGCRALIDQIFGVGGLTSVTILAELGDPRRFDNSRDVVRYAGMDITVHQSDAHRSHAKARPRCAGRYMKQHNAPASQPALTGPITSSSLHGSAVTAHASRSRASCSNAATTSSENSATKRSRPSPKTLSRGKPRSPDEPRPAPGKIAADPSQGTAQKE